MDSKEVMTGTAHHRLVLTQPQFALAQAFWLVAVLKALFVRRGSYLVFG